MSKLTVGSVVSGALFAAMSASAALDVSGIDWNGTIRPDWPSDGVAYALAAPNSTNYVRGSTGDANHGNWFIELQEGSTLVVTQGVIKTLWSNIIATNGAATIVFEEAGYTTTPVMRGHLVCHGKGSLEIQVKIPNASTLEIGQGDGVFPVVELKNVTFSLPSGTVVDIPNTMLYSIPKDASKIVFGKTAGKTYVVADGALDLSEGVVTGAGQLIVTTSGALRSDLAYRVRGGARLTFMDMACPTVDLDDPARFPTRMSVDPGSTALTIPNDVVLEGGVLSFANMANEIALSGRLSGLDGTVSIDGADGVFFTAKNPLAVRLAGDNSGFLGTVTSSGKGNSVLWLDHANAVAGATVDTSNGLIVRVNPSLTTADVGTLASGGSLPSASGQTVRVGTATGAYKMPGAGTIHADDLWKTNILAWFDFSTTNWCRNIGESLHPDEYVTGRQIWEDDAHTKPYVEQVSDCWFEDPLITLWNRRAYNNGTIDRYPQCYLYLTPGGPNGFTYLTSPTDRTTRRLPFNTVTSTGFNTSEPVMAAMAILVFGSQNGGGGAILGTKASSLKRRANPGSATACATLADPVAYDYTKDIWIDGEKIADPSKAYFSGGWQIISIDTLNVTLTGLGLYGTADSGYTNTSGQNYGEVILLKNMPTEFERRIIEEYLAAKWGLTDAYKPGIGSARAEQIAGETNAVALVGSGDVVASGDVPYLVSGCFDGKITLDGGTLCVKPGQRAYTASDIPRTGLEYWIDPEDATTLDFYSRENGGFGVLTAKDRNGRTDLYFTTSDKRNPILRREARFGGPLRNWLNFSLDTDPDGNGRNMRTNVKTQDIGSPAKFSIQSAFVAMDSVHGGGNPILSALTGDAIVKTRAGDAANEPIWPSGSADAVVNGVTRLNGSVVDQTKGFTGAPEVFSFAWTDIVTPAAQWFLDDYTASTSLKHPDSLVLGEALYYSCALSEADARGIEAYLMKKWLGRLPDGFCELDGMTVAGTGEVRLSAGSQVPKLDADFAGSVKSESSSYAAAIDSATGTVTGGLVAPAAAAELPAACALTVTFDGRPRGLSADARYTLVDLGSVAAPVVWTVDVNLPADRWSVETSNDGAKVVLVYKKSGCVISLR